MSQPMLPRLFVVDDEPLLVSTLARILNMSGFHAVAFTGASEALKAAEEDAPSILLSDVQMPEMNGIELAILFRGLYPACKILLFSGFADTTQLLEDARRQGHDFHVLPKPMKPTDLLMALRRL